ncbi:MAG: glycosyltransferase family A protein [Vulcanimicrobiaceae bacterium]
MNGSVGVIIGAHNAERFLGETLASIGRQTLQPETVIVVDDGSTDDTARIAASWGARVMSQPKSGAAGARNTAIPNMQTTFVAFCDADDVWEPTKLQQQRDALDANPDCAFSFCDYYDFTSEKVQHGSVLKEVLNHFKPQDFQRSSGTTYRCERERINALTLQHSFILPSTFLIRNDLLQALRAFRVDFVTEEDVEMLLRIFKSTDAMYVDEPLMGYRRHETNITADPRRQRVGMLRIAAHVVAHPASYRPESAVYYRSMFPTYLFKAGRMFASLGDIAIARWFLARSFELEPSPRAALWFVLSTFFRFSAIRLAARRARGA